MRNKIPFILLICFLIIQGTGIANAQEGDEFQRFLQFMSSHPEGGVFIMQKDMYMEDDATDAYGIYTNQATYTIRTNGNTIIMKDITITNQGEFDYNQIYHMPSLIIEGRANIKPLVRILGEVRWEAVEIKAEGGTAVSIGEYGGISYYNNLFSSIHASGEQAVAIQIDEDAQPSIRSIYVYADGKDAIAIQGKQAYLSDLYVQVDGEQAIPFSYHNTFVMEDDFVAIHDHGVIDYNKWEITTSYTPKEVYALHAQSVYDLPIAEYADLELERNGEEAYRSSRILFDEAAFQHGMSIGKPFILQGRLNELDAALLNVPEDAFQYVVYPKQEPILTANLLKYEYDRCFINMDRPYGAVSIHVYGSENQKDWTYISNEINAMKEAWGPIPPSRISLLLNEFNSTYTYVKIHIRGGYYDGMETIVTVQEKEASVDKEETQKPNDDGGNSGNPGQGGGRTESNYDDVAYGNTVPKKKRKQGIGLYRNAIKSTGALSCIDV